MLVVAAALLGAALGPWLARATVRLARRDHRVAPARVRVTVTTVVTAALLAGTAALTDQRPALVGLLWVAAAGVVLAGVDLAVHRLPDAATFPAIGVLAASLVVDAAVEDSAKRALDGLLAGAVAFGITALVRLLRPDALGFGDVKLLGLLGLVLGWRGGGSLVLTGVFLGLLLGAVGALVLVALRRAGWRSAIPFGPALLSGAAVAFALAGPL